MGAEGELSMGQETKSEYYSGPQAADFTDAPDPMALFEAWFADAEANEPNDPNAMSLATVDQDGLPNVRMVLLKGADEGGFVFYTNTQSAKGEELTRVPKAALCFHWKSLRRQVRVRGDIAPVSEAEADAYFASRSRGSQLGAWASQQSRTLESRFALEKAVAVQTTKFHIGKVPRPPYWSGYRLTPTAVEFWHDRPFRLHDRVAFLRDDADSPWSRDRLYP